jgi:hypothetical protein
MMFPQILSLIALCTSLISAHTVVTYPGWRGDNLVTNDTFPYGMQWMYPCKSKSYLIGRAWAKLRGLDGGYLWGRPKLCSINSTIFFSYSQNIACHPLTHLHRRWYAHIEEQNNMAITRGSCSYPARLVPGSRNGLLLHQLGIWN